MIALEKQRVLVSGCSGRSGAAAARLCHHLGATVILSDRNVESHHWPDGAAVPGKMFVDVRPREDAALVDEHSPDLIITAPGVPLTHPLLARAREKGVPIFGENDFAFQELRRLSPYLVLGVTGTDGKSTTTALVAHLLSELGVPAIPCGNFGLPLSELALSPPSASTVLVVECSSFQLEPLVFFHPNAAAILNVAPDHQDRYSSAEDYLAAKLRIAELLSGEDELFVGPGLARAVAARFPGHEQRTTEVDYGAAPELGAWGRQWTTLAGALGLAGAHNRSNLGFALALVHHTFRLRGLSLDTQRLRQAVASFRGLPHRMEVIGESPTLRFVNDSKATTIQAVTRALESFGDGNALHHLLGGRSKGADFRELRGVAPKATLYPFGEAARDIALVLGVARTYANLEAAVRAAASNGAQRAELDVLGGGHREATQKQTILLSPACASYDEFRSFEERGARFSELAREILRASGGSLTGGGG